MVTCATGVALLLLLHGSLAVASRSGARQKAAQSLRRDLRVWLARGGATALEAEEKIGERQATVDAGQQQEDDTNEKIIEALLVKQKRLEGQNRALRAELDKAHAQLRGTGSVGTAAVQDKGALQALQARLAAEQNKTAALQADVRKGDEEARGLRQSLAKAKRALLQSVDAESAADSAAAGAQSQALAAANAQNAKLTTELHQEEARRRTLQASVTQLQVALNQSLVAVGEAQHQLAGAGAANAVDERIEKAQRQIADLQKENMKLKIAGHTLMQKFDELRKRR